MRVGSWLSKMEKSKGEQADKDSFERPGAERGEGPRCWGDTWQEARSFHRAPTCEQDGEVDHNHAADEGREILLSPGAS